MNFKEELIAEAKYSVKDIPEHLVEIKDRMLNNAFQRTFRIELIKFYVQNTCICNNPKSSKYSISIPNNINPTLYCQVLLKEFENWGFEKSEIEYEEEQKGFCRKFIIVLSW